MAALDVKQSILAPAAMGNDFGLGGWLILYSGIHDLLRGIDSLFFVFNWHIVRLNCLFLLPPKKLLLLLDLH